MRILKFIIFWILSLNIYALDLDKADNNTDKAVCNSTEIASGAEMVSGTCFYKRERISGMNKICTYDCISGEKSITISSVKLCPLNIAD